MEIEQKFFVFVGILEKGMEMHYSSAISQLTCRIYTSALIQGRPLIGGGT